MTLRDQLIKAAASAIAGDRGEWTEDMREEFFQDAAVALDAILDTLSENTGEWKLIAYAMYSTTDPDEFGAAAIAALRDTGTGGS